MITQTQCAIFKQNVYNGLENFSATTPYTYKIALYTALADLGVDTIAYTSTNEVVGDGYTAGGETLTLIPTQVDTQTNTAYVSFNNVTWNPAAFTTRGALVYNANTGAACFILNFGSDKICSNSFTIQFPAATYSSAILTLGTTTSSINYSSPD